MRRRLRDAWRVLTGRALVITPASSDLTFTGSTVTVVGSIEIGA